MRIARSIAEYEEWRRNAAGDAGFVPTMGYLHEGHLSLVRAARRENDRCVVSIFVNPAQFAPGEDLETYPRDEARDLDLLEAEGTDIVLIPPVAEMYPARFSTYVVVEGLTSVLEGASRPAHFRGVTTIVLKLLNITQPRRAYFGQKDAQQLAVIRRMVEDLNLRVEVIGMPIVREPDGLAMSSRNVRLSPDERRAALVLRRALEAAEAAYARGERDASRIRELVRAMILSEPLATLDYVSVADAVTLQELSVIDRPALVSLAVRFGATRLIDNTTLPSGD